MTAPEHELVIPSDLVENVNTITNDLDMGNGETQWKDDGAVVDTDSGSTTYSYSTNDGSDSLTLTVDENINNTGL